MVYIPTVTKPAAEVVLVFNGYMKHLEDGRNYRNMMERLLGNPRYDVRLFVDDKATASAIERKRGIPTSCKVEFAFLHPKRESMVLVRSGERIRGCYFTYESTAGRYSPSEAVRMWNEVTTNIKKPKRRNEE